VTTFASEVVCTVRVEEVDTFDGFVTPSSSTVSASPAGTLAAVIVQSSTVWEFDPQSPTFPLASVTTPRVIVNVLEPGGKVIVIWLWAAPDIPPPVAEVVKETV
jgi:hypothetical protein